MLGEAGHDILTSGLADDIIDGGEGNDLITGGFGHDMLVGGLGFDTILESGDVNMTLTNASLQIGSYTDSLDGIESLHFTGGKSDNLMDASAFTMGPVVIMVVYLLIARKLGAFDAL